MDVLRLVAIMAVVFLHATAVKSDAASLGSPVWHLVNVFNPFSSTGVPLFLMISGGLVLGSPKTISVGYTVKTRVPRLLVPLLVWSLFYLGYAFAASWLHTGTADWAGLAHQLAIIPKEPVRMHLWFMYVIIPLYILSPLLKRLVESLTKDLVIYLLVLWGLFCCLVPTLVAPFVSLSDTTFSLDANDLRVAPVFVGYFIAGYYLMRLRRPIRKRWLVAVIIFDWVVMTLGTWWRTVTFDRYDSLLVGYNNVFAVTMSVAVFLLCKELLAGRRLGRYTGGVVGIIGPMVFGVYLVHPFFIRLMTGGEPVRSIGLQIGYYFAELAASVACIMLLSMVKPLCYLFIGQRYRAWWRREKPGQEA